MTYQDLMKLEDYIYLHKIYEPVVNSLRILIDRAKASEKTEKIEIDGGFTVDTYPIVVNESLPIIQLDFDSYIAYSITNESFTVVDEEEICEGKVFKVYKKSKYLEFVVSTTIATDMFPEYQPVHYEIACLDHIIDIISFKEPKVTEIKRKKFFGLRSPKTINYLAK